MKLPTSRTSFITTTSSPRTSTSQPRLCPTDAQATLKRPHRRVHGAQYWSAFSSNPSTHSPSTRTSGTLLPHSSFHGRLSKWKGQHGSAITAHPRCSTEPPSCFTVEVVGEVFCKKVSLTDLLLVLRSTNPDKLLRCIMKGVPSPMLDVSNNLNTAAPLTRFIVRPILTVHNFYQDARMAFVNAVFGSNEPFTRHISLLWRRRRGGTLSESRR